VGRGRRAPGGRRWGGDARRAARRARCRVARDRGPRRIRTATRCALARHLGRHGTARGCGGDPARSAAPRSFRRFESRARRAHPCGRATTRATHRSRRDGECRRRRRSAGGARRAPCPDARRIRRRCSAAGRGQSLRRAEGRHARRRAPARGATPRIGRTGAVCGATRRGPGTISWTSGDTCAASKPGSVVPIARDGGRE